MLPALVLDPAQEDVAVAAFRQVADELTRRAFSEVLGEDAEDLLADFELPERDARKFVRGLRNEGLGEIRLPYFVKNQPGVTALKPWEDVFFHPESTDLQRTRVFEREWVTEVELRTRGKLEGWDADWIEQAAKCKGYASTWTVDGLGNDRLLNAPWDYNWMPRSSELIEIIHAYVPQVDDDGVRCVTHTILHAKVTRDDLTGKDNLCAKSERLELDHGQMPFVAGLREPTRWIYCALMVVAFPIGFVISHVMMWFIYYVVITPIGLVFRVMGRDMLGRRLEPQKASYWHERSRPRDPASYFKLY